MKGHIKYKTVLSEPDINDYIERFWMLANPADEVRQLMVIPDGRIDILFSFSLMASFHGMLLGIETDPSEIGIEPGAITMGVSLKLPAVEFLLTQDIAGLLNAAQPLPDNFWGIKIDDLYNFENFCTKVGKMIRTLIKPINDQRKKALFNLIYSSEGSLSVSELAETVNWRSRQINRYFQKRFGLSLKTYCTILRFRASLLQIKDGRLYPEQNFSDQAHFIREVKKLSGVVPKELARNKNDRFIQLSTIAQK